MAWYLFTCRKIICPVAAKTNEFFAAVRGLNEMKENKYENYLIVINDTEKTEPKKDIDK